MSERSEAKSRKHAKTILPLIRFSTQCETSRRNGATTGRFRKVSVRHAPRWRRVHRAPGQTTISPMVSLCVLRLEGFHVGTFRSEILQACLYLSTPRPPCSTLFPFTSLRRSDRTVPKGFGTPRAEAARVHRAPGRTTTAGPSNNQPPRQESTAQEQPTAQ